jgi:hypothetical protein
MEGFSTRIFSSKFRLKRIVMSSIPMIKKGTHGGKRGCRPILLIYRSDGMIPLLTRQGQQTRLYLTEETNPVVWEFDDLYTEGDILIQCRHFNKVLTGLSSHL